MPREKVESIKLFSRLSKNNMSEEELEFVKEQIENQSPSQFVRQAVRVFYKYSEGKLFEVFAKRIKELGLEGVEELGELENEELYNSLDNGLDKGFF